jgi:hypothetical protein
MQLPGHQVIGTRRQQVGQLPVDHQVEIWRKVTSAIVKYGYVVEYRDLEPPRTGIFDGFKLVIDPDVGFEMQCFILLHLFGHSVQWTAPSLAHKLDALQTTTEKSAFMAVLKAYEYEAAGFGLQLLHECGINDLDAWFSDFVATDWKYVERFYDEDRLPPWDECIVHSAPTISAAPIPKIVHRQVEVRYAF